MIGIVTRRREITMVKVREERGFGFYEWREESRIKTKLRTLSRSVERAIAEFYYSPYMVILRSNSAPLVRQSGIGYNSPRRKNTPLISLKRVIATASVLALVVQAAAPGVFFPAPLASAENGNLCAVDADVVLVMDRSGSMADGEAPSLCEWYKEELVGQSKQCVAEYTTGLTQEECENNNDGCPTSSPYTPDYTPATNSKITDAKFAANTFLDYLGTNDQSGLVSFSDVATPDKGLDNDHLIPTGTQKYVNDLITGGATNIGDAIAEGTVELTSERANPQAVKVMILLTDGQANMPSDVGDPEDYAKEKATEAAALGYKIFTIGLGDDVNETMLQDIAAITQAEYHHTPTSAGLEGIYDSIASEICQYGSISGCKFNDANNNNFKDLDEDLLGDWTINLMRDDEIIETQNTISDLENEMFGCYKFAGLAVGEYTVSETQQEGWEQTLPSNPDNYNIIITANGENFTEQNFGNFQTPVCVDSDDDGYYAFDAIYCSEGNDCDDGDPNINPGAEEVCDDGIDNNCDGLVDCADSDCDGDDACEESECAEGEIKSCDYTGQEGTEGIGICHAGNQTCVNGSWGECEGEVTPQDEICDDQTDNNCNGQVDEGCGGDEEESPSGGGGGWTPPPVIKITDEKADCLGGGETVITWKTNVTTTNQVAYGDSPITTLGDVPEYGYDFVNEESGSMWMEHSVTITGLTGGAEYYFRPIADRNGSEEVVGKEVFCAFEEKGEVKGVSDPPMPTPTPAECNYLLEYIKLNADNNSVEVEKLERFLNEFEGEDLLVNGIYEQVDFDAVSRFQEKYLEDILSPWSHNAATGYVYITTKKKINELYCQREFPLTAEQETEIELFDASDFVVGSENSTAKETSEEAPENSKDETSKTDEVELPEEDGEVLGVEDDKGLDKDEKIVKDDGYGEVEETEFSEEGDKKDNATVIEALSNRWWLIIIIVLAIAGGAWYLKKERKEE